MSSTRVILSFEITEKKETKIEGDLIHKAADEVKSTTHKNTLITFKDTSNDYIEIDSNRVDINKLSEEDKTKLLLECMDNNNEDRAIKLLSTMNYSQIKKFLCIYDRWWESGLKTVFDFKNYKVVEMLVHIFSFEISNKTILDMCPLPRIDAFYVHRSAHEIKMEKLGEKFFFLLIGYCIADIMLLNGN